MSFPEIRTLVPHSGHMVLLDRVITADTESLSAEVNIRSDSMFYEGEGVGAWVGIEYMAQAIAAYAGYVAQMNGDSVKVGFLLGTRRYECMRPYFSLGDQLRIEVKHLFQAENGLGSFECTIHRENELLASATLTVFQPENIQEFL